MRAAFSGSAAVLLLVAIFVVICPSDATSQEAQQFVVTATHGAVIRAEPSTSSGRIAVVPKDTVLEVVAVLNTEWVQVIMPATGQKGYIYRTLGLVHRAEGNGHGTASSAPAPASQAAVPSSASTPPSNHQSTPTPAPVSPTPSSNPAPASAPSAVKAPHTEPGQFGVGLQLGVNPGGAEPSILYDLKHQPLTIRGLFNFGSGWSAFGAQGLFRFQNKGSSSGTAIVPYVGGGLFLINVDYGLLGGSQRFTGFLGSGGIFFTFHSLPSVRFSAEINVPVYSYGTFAQPALSGIYFGLGGHYFFPTSR